MLYLTPFITAYCVFLALVLGLCIGSFCNAWAWRLTHGEKISKGRSHCAVCGHTLSVPDLIPVLSYIFLRGKCRYCGERISPRYLISECVLGLYFVSVLLVNDISLITLRYWGLGTFVFIAALTDLETQEVPDRLHVFAALFVLLRIAEEGWNGALSALIGAIAVAVPLLVIVLIADKVMGRETMGGADIKLIAVLGLHFGWAVALLLLILSCIFGIVFAFAAKRKGKEFPFVPALGLAAWVCALAGNEIVSAYLSLFTGGAI